MSSALGHSAQIASTYRLAAASRPTLYSKNDMDELKVRFATGQPGAMRDIYERFARSVFAVSYRILGNSSLAEEAMQQTFLQAWRAADRYDRDRELAPWLHTIARRAAIDVYRRERRHRSEQVEDDSVTSLPPSLETTWAVWEVRRALDALPEDERNVLHATHFHGLTHEEAAAHLGVPLGTVKSRSHRAYRRLAGMLAHVGEVIR